ncbi:unnamed protein product [Symbiodinium natans]|uniref:Uncharacterized protein n=1 Tax=Symbiodinium natans TaxID=878477 RepID=A0A812TCC6_9DINO|nr:unnamed protein product [Symbiodinium natans]
MYALVYSAIVVVSFSAHLHFLGEHIWRALTRAYQSLPETQVEDPKAKTDDRLSHRLATIRAFNFKAVCNFTVNINLGLFLVMTWRFFQESTIINLAVSLMPLIEYVVCCSVVSGSMRLTSRTLMCASSFQCGLIHIYAVMASLLSPTSATEHIMTFSMLSTTHIVAGLIFLNARMWIPSAVLLCMSDLAMFMHKFGRVEISMLLCSSHVTQLVVCCVILAAVELGVCTHLQSEMDKDDDKTLMAGFQKILKGLCEGSLILDSRCLVRGSPSCLQRLLSTKKNFEDVSFISLIACPESKEQFGTLVRTGASSQANDTEASLPACLRVVLSEGGQEVPVDIFHAALPGLFGADEPHHILAFVEDTAGREAAQAMHGFPEWQSNVRRSLNRRPVPSASSSSSQSRSEAASTAGARSNEVLEVMQELAEATFLIDPGSASMDLLEAHLRFNRGHHLRQPPSLRMLSKINQWDTLQSLLRTYALSVHQGGQGVPDLPLPIALPAMQVRVPGAPRKLLKAKHVRLSLANRSRELGQPIYLYLHLKGFIKKHARPSYITGIQGDAVEEEPDDGPGEDADEPVAEYQSLGSFVPPQNLPEDGYLEGPIFNL